MKKIITHDGKFHTDECMSIAIMTLAVPGCGSKVVRTRKVTYEDMTDPETYVIDVGDDFNPHLNNYDHHQARGPVRTNGIPYSSAGLIWEEFGRQIVKDERTPANRCGRQWAHQRLSGELHSVNCQLFQYGMERRC